MVQNIGNVWYCFRVFWENRNNCGKIKPNMATGFYSLLTILQFLKNKKPQLLQCVLAEGIWYLVRSNEKKESAFGFWKAKGEACKVYSNGMISGWRTTLEYFDHGQITDWLMQEYRITLKKLSDKDKPKVLDTTIEQYLCSFFNVFYLH